MDPEPLIRTNTCILIGRLGPSLGYNTKRKVLVPAFSRALKDTFVHARVAGLMAFMATIECFEIEEMAVKVIPNMSFTLVDKEKCVAPNHLVVMCLMSLSLVRLVRDQAFKAIDLFLQKIESHVKSMVCGFQLPPVMSLNLLQFQA
jgi:SCY1-like protein 1